MPSRAGAAQTALETDRDFVQKHVRAAGTNATLLRSLRAAEKDLTARLKALAPQMRGSFSEAQMKATLAQVRASARVAAKGIQGAAVEEGTRAAEGRAERVLGYLEKADEAYRGVGSTPLALEHAALYDRAVSGAGASILGRLGESGEGKQGAAADEHRAKGGILRRYGVATVKSFEQELTKGILARKSFDEVAEDLTKKSPFLKAQPRFWAERIVRTECLAGDTPVSGAVVRAVFRRWYEGPIVKIVTDGGREFTATPNHPMLTRRAWVGAHDLQPGDDLVCYRGQQRARPASDEHVERRPSTIGEIFDALAAVVVGERRRGAKPDFHGDGKDGEVDVLRPDRPLAIGSFAALYEPTLKHVFTPTEEAYATLCSSCHRLLSIQKQSCFCGGSNGNTRVSESCLDGVGVDSEVHRETLRALSELVATDDLVRGDLSVEGRRQSPALEEACARLRERTDDACFSSELLHTPGADPEALAHNVGAQPGDVEFDRVRSVCVVDFSGHVFNLTTEDGYYAINGAYTGNTMGAANRSALDAIKAVDEEDDLGGFAKILSASFDDRTGWDSYMVHGQIRRPEEPFAWADAKGHVEEYMAPPNRPNDREIVVPHALRWPIPEALRWLPASEYRRVFVEQVGKKRKPPARPKMTTIPLDRFAKE